MKSKYKNIITKVGNIKFHSKKEAKRYQELLLLKKAGEIKELELQYPFKVAIENKHICTYYADFVYQDQDDNMTVEDVKGGIKTPVYKLKKRLVEAYWGIKITEI